MDPRRAAEYITEVTLEYGRLKALFGKFLAAGEGWLNNNDRFPTLAFKASADGCSATLSAVGRDFIILFQTLDIEGQHAFGVVDVLRIEHGDKRTPMCRTLFNRHEQVFEVPEGPVLNDDLASKRFLALFVAKVLQAHFEAVKKPG